MNTDDMVSVSVAGERYLVDTGTAELIHELIRSGISIEQDNEHE